MVTAFLSVVTFMRGAAGAAAFWARYRSNAVFSRSVGSYFCFPASGSGFLGGLKSLISVCHSQRGHCAIIPPNIVQHQANTTRYWHKPTVHGVVLQKFEGTPPARSENARPRCRMR